MALTLPVINAAFFKYRLLCVRCQVDNPLVMRFIHRPRQFVRPFAALQIGVIPFTYTTLKRLMAAIGSDTAKPRIPAPAASTRKHGPAPAPGPDVYVRDASHYATGEHRVSGGGQEAHQ